MTTIAIPGVTREQYDETTAEAGLRPFPVAQGGKWTAQTAEVVGINILETDQNDWLIIRGKNECFGVQVRVSLNPMHIPFDCGQDRDKVIERNTNKLLKVLKAFDLATFKGNNGLILETSRFEGVLGKTFGFSIQKAMSGGMPVMNEKGFQRLNVSFKGTVPKLLPVTVPPDSSEVPVNSCALNSSTGDDDDIIPF